MGPFLFLLIAPLGALAGAGLGVALASAYASAANMSSREGKSGYFMGAAGGICGLAGFASAGVASLTWTGSSLSSSLLFVLLYAVALGALTFGGFAVAAWARGGLAVNRAKPELLIELRGALPDHPRISIQERSETPRPIENLQRGAPDMASGSTELFVRTLWRTLIVSGPDGERFFEIAAGATPRHTDEPGPWRKADRFHPAEGGGTSDRGTVELRWRVRDPNVEYARDTSAA